MKQQWYDLTTRGGKAEFAKDVLAIANATEPERAGYLVFGIEDAKHGGRILGVDKTPDCEQLQQILSAYTSPVPELQCFHIPFAGVTVSVLRVGWTPYHPYYATRDHLGILDSRLVYTRRGGTVGVLWPREFEDLLRRKETRIGRVESEQILNVGFVESGRGGGRKVVARIVNLTDEPIEDLAVTWDVRLPAWPAAFMRIRSFVGGQLGAAETREAEIDPSAHYFVSQYSDLKIQQGFTPGTAWFEVTLCVEFRDRSGFLQQLVRHLSVGG